MCWLEAVNPSEGVLFANRRLTRPWVQGLRFSEIVDETQPATLRINCVRRFLLTLGNQFQNTLRPEDTAAAATTCQIQGWPPPDKRPCDDDSLAEAKLAEDGVQQIVDGGLADHLS